MRSKSLCVYVWVSVWFRVCYALYKYYFCLPFLFPEQNIFYILLDLFHNYLSLHLNSVCVPFATSTFDSENVFSFLFSTSSEVVLLLLNCKFACFFYSFNFIFDHRRLLVTFTPNRITTPWVALLTSTDRKHDGRARVWLCDCVWFCVVVKKRADIVTQYLCVCLCDSYGNYKFVQYVSKNTHFFLDFHFFMRKKYGRLMLQMCTLL